MKQTCQRVVVVTRGETESDHRQALDEAMRHIREGCLTGADSNDTGAYYFDVSDEVPKSEWPA